MKFLVFCTQNSSASMVPPGTIRQLFESTISWVEGQKKAGKLLDSWGLVGEKGTVALVEHSSLEDLETTMLSMPLNGFVDFKVYPLADLNTTLKATLDYLTAAEKMMAGQPKAVAGVR
jgi:muconolactone delta-isomerase